jgi:hypothetical protein
MKKEWITMVIAAVLLVGGALILQSAEKEYICAGQCAHHTPRGKRCQDRCFKKGFCPQEDR